jgi:hypothetical protein
MCSLRSTTIYLQDDGFLLGGVLDLVSVHTPVFPWHVFLIATLPVYTMQRTRALFWFTFMHCPKLYRKPARVRDGPRGPCCKVQKQARMNDETKSSGTNRQKSTNTFRSLSSLGDNRSLLSGQKLSLAPVFSIACTMGAMILLI